MNNYQLLSALLNHLQPLLPLAREAILLNLALTVLSLAQSHDCHLATLVTVWPVKVKRTSLIQRLRRWLLNRYLTPRVYYLPLAKHLLHNWQGAEIALSMDRTDLSNRLSLLVIGIAFKGRLIPLAFEVYSFGSTNTQQQIAILEQIRPLLPDAKEVRITLFADAEFRAVDLQKYCLSQHWHWQVGIKSDTLFRFPNGQWLPLSTLKPKKGERLYIQGIYLTKKHNFGLVNLIVNWSANEDYPRYIILDTFADRHAWRRGRKRFWIEPTFRDWKSYGFDLENSKLNKPHQIRSMVLAMAVTYLWMLHLAQTLTKNGQREMFESPHKQDYSLFRLGRDSLRRSFALGEDIEIGFTLTP